MLLTLNIKNESMKESFVNFLKTLDYVEIQNENNTNNELQHHQNKKINLKNLLECGQIVRISHFIQ
jgi:hypothetical protein